MSNVFLLFECTNFDITRKTRDPQTRRTTSTSSRGAALRLQLFKLVTVLRGSGEGGVVFVLLQIMTVSVNHQPVS